MRRQSKLRLMFLAVLGLCLGLPAKAAALLLADLLLDIVLVLQIPFFFLDQSSGGLNMPNNPLVGVSGTLSDLLGRRCPPGGNTTASLFFEPVKTNCSEEPSNKRHYLRH